MNKIMTMVSAIMMVATMNAKSVNTEAFTETKVNVPARVRFVKGDTYSFSVESENKIVAESIKANVKNGVLTFNLGIGLSAEEASENNLTIIITAPGMPEFKTSRNVMATNIKEADADTENSFTCKK